MWELPKAAEPTRDPKQWESSHKDSIRGWFENKLNFVGP